MKMLVYLLYFCKPHDENGRQPISTNVFPTSKFLVCNTSGTAEQHLTPGLQWQMLLSWYQTSLKRPWRSSKPHLNPKHLLQIKHLQSTKTLGFFSIRFPKRTPFVALSLLGSQYCAVTLLLHSFESLLLCHIDFLSFSLEQFLSFLF